MKDTNIHQAANIAVFTPTPRKYDRLHKRQGNLMLKHLAALLLLAAIITPAPSLAQTAATATLAGTVTEANLFAATASTVSVTLTNTEYEATGTLMQSHFSVTDTVVGTVSVSDVTRDSDTGATLTLAYSGEDITAASTLSVTLAAEGHTGADALTTNTIPITASAGSNVCGRTRQVRDRIVAQSSATECTNVDLAAVMTLDLNGRLIAALQGGDFTGLTMLQDLDLSRNRLDALPANVFAGLTALEDLDLSSNSLGALPDNVFAGLTALQDLDLSINSLGALPANVFAGLTALQILDLNTNRLTALPPNVFDELTALMQLHLNGNGLTALPPNIFSRLTALLSLDLSVNQLATLDAGIFNGLSEIVTLRLDRNLLNALPASIFNGLSQLGILTLNDNRLAELPNDVFAGLSGLFSLFLDDNNLTELDANIFDGLSSLTNLSLHDNLFTADTGLPAGVFDDVLGMLGPILIPPEPSSGSAFSIDNTVRLAHFVCSRADAMRIVDATGVDDCLRVSSEQLNAYQQADASLSSLTISEGILVPPFDPSTTAYAVTLANSVASVMVTPTAAQSSATITVNNAAVTSGNTSDAIDLLMPGVAAEINIVVTAAGGTTQTYTVRATRLVTTAPTAALVATPPLTEAALFADTASTVTVTLTGTEYVDMLTPAHFITSDTVTGGSVTVSEVVRTDGMVATLTLGFSGRDLSAAGNLLVAVAAAGHTGSDDVPAGSVPISASTGINICRRTAAVIGVIRATITPAPDCTSVTEADLQSITSLDLSSRMIDSLQSGDFAGLPMLASLNLSDNSLTALPKDIFADLTALRELRLSNNQLTTLDAEIFAGLTALEELFLVNSGLTTLPFGLSEGLSALRTLWLSGNAFTTLPPSIFEPLNMLANLNLQDNSMLTAGTGLSIGIFNRVLDTLGTISTATSGDGFLIDDTVLAAHFVCSRDDADAIVAATSGVSNCLRISSGQLFAYQQADVSLSGLTISAGDLMPPFDPAIADYNVVVAHNIASVTVTPTANSAIRGATITVNGVAVDSGSDSVAIDLMAGAVVPIAIEVRSASSVTRAYTVRVTRAAAPVAMLAVPAPLTEADLNGATVTVTLTDSTYVSTLSADDFTLTTVGGVTVSGVAPNSGNTVATLTLVYDGTDITTDGTLLVTLRAAGHVGDGDLTTGTVPITANRAPVFDLGESIDAQSYTMDVGISDITLPTATGGNGALSYGITPALPNGLTLSGNTLSGTPTAMQALTNYTYTVGDSDSDMTDTDTLMFTIVIAANPITGDVDGAVTEDNSTNTDTGMLTLAPTPGGNFVAQDGTTDRAGGLGTYGSFVLNATSGEWTYTLDNDRAATDALVADAMVTDVFTAVSATDSGVTRDVIITVTGANDAPTANAGPDQPAVISGAPVTLDGSGSSDPDTGDAIDTYTWTHTGGTPSVTLTGPATEMPTFTAPTVTTATTLTFTLVVNDGTDDSPADTVDIIVNADTAPDFASATIDDQTYTESVDIGAVTLPAATGGNGALAYMLTPSLPDGLIFTAADRTITGAPASGTMQAATTYTYTVSDSDADIAGSDTDTLSFTIAINAVTGPSVDSVEISTDGPYASGDVIEVTVTFSGAVTVTGAPQIALTVDMTTRQAVYDRGSDSTALVFTYTVQDGENDADGVSIAENSLTLPGSGDAIQDAGGNDAVLDHDEVAADAAQVVDTTAPTVSSVEISSDGPYGVGAGIDVTATFSEAVVVTGTPVIMLRVSTPRTTTAVTGTGTDTLVFTYMVEAGDDDTDGVSIEANMLAQAGGSTIQDAAGNNAVLDHSPVAAAGDQVVDSVLPTVSSGTISGTEAVVTFSEALDDTSAPANSAWRFAVSTGAGGSLRFIGGVDGISINGSVVTLTLNIPFAENENVFFDYTQPGTGTSLLRDLAGNNVATFFTRALTNNTPMPTATLAAPTQLTEANLNTATVTVTLMNTRYVRTDDLDTSDFRLSENVAGAVTLSGVVRTSATVATLTLAYDGEVFTGDGTLGVIIEDFGHAGAGTLTTATVPVTAAPNTAPAFGSGASIAAQSYTMDVPVTPVTLPTATGGNGALSYAITPALPANLILTDNVLSGTPAAMQALTTYTYTVGDSDSDMADTDTDTLMFTIVIAANTITGGTAGAVTEDNSTNTATGTLAVTGGFVAQTGATNRAGGLGTYGNFVLDATSGVWTYTLNNDPTTTQGAATHALAEGDVVTDIFTAVSATTATVQREVTITITGANDAPTADAGAPQTVTAGATVTLDGSGSSDPDTGDTIDTYTWTPPTTAPLNTTIPAMPTFTAPDVTTATTLSFTLVVNDGTADSAPDTVDITVNPTTTNRAPVAVIAEGASLSVDAGATVMLTSTGSNDPDSDPITHVWRVVTDGVPTLTLATTDEPSLSFTAPTVTTADDYTIGLIVNDGTTDSTEATIVVTVNPTGADLMPTFGSATIPNQTYIEGTTITAVILPTATSGDAPLAYTLTPALPNGLSFNTATRMLSGTPTAMQAAVTYTYTVTDNDGDTDTLTFTITVQADTAPMFAGGIRPSFTFAVGTSIDSNGFILPLATGGNGALTYTIDLPLPTGLTLEHTPPLQPALRGTPAVGTEQSATGYTYIVTDSDGDTDTLTFTLAILAAGSLPNFDEAITFPDQTYTVGVDIGAVTLPAATGGSAPLRYSLPSRAGRQLPAGLRFDPDTRVLSGTPEEAFSGEYFYLVTDADGRTDSLLFDIIVNAVAPDFGTETIAAQVYTVGTAIGSVTLPVATGVDTPFTYIITPPLPNGVVLTGNTLSGTPAAMQDAITYTYTVTDSDGDTDTLRFTITVNPAGSDTGPTEEQTEQLHEEIAPQVVQTIAGNVVAAVGTRIETTIRGAPGGGVRLDGQGMDGDGKAVLLGFLDKAPEYTRSIQEGTLDWKRMLANSSFALNAAGDSGNSGLGVWGSGHYTGFDGDDNNLDWDGDSYGFQIGTDTRWRNNLLTGVSVSWSEGDVEYTQGGADAEKGDYTLTLTGIHPYVGWSNDSGSLSLWGSAGYADGEVEIEPDEGVKRKHDASVVSLAGGFTRSLTDILSIKGDFSSLEAEIDEADEVLNDSDLSIDSQRVRLLLEVRYQQRLPGGSTLARSAEVGYRLDEGDSNADTDGTEVGVSMDYHNPDTRLTLSGKARGLVGDNDYREWGISGLIRLESGTQGLSFTLEPGYGDTAGSAGELWQRKTPSLETERQSYGASMKMHLGYGLHGGIMPYTEVTSGEALRSFRMGVKWQLGKALDLNLFGEQYEADESDNSLQLEGKLEF